MKSILNPEGADATIGGGILSIAVSFLKEPDLALEEARSDPRRCKVQLQRVLTT